jgi:hypothetical protein
MARNKSIYTTAIAISPADKQYIQTLRLELGKQSDAGTLAHIIYEHQKNNSIKNICVN